MKRKKLPIGIQSFVEMRSNPYCYADKTAYIEKLVDAGKYYFVSRPRRFGKSLLLDTIDCAFSGRREFFEGLHLTSDASEWDWTQTNPVLRIDWSIAAPQTPQALEERILEIISYWEKKWDCRTGASSIGGRFISLVKYIHESTGQKVVILVDEYDKPILDAIRDPAMASMMRDILKQFYTNFKPLDPHLRFLLLTGVSKFSKTGIFSGLNNLDDITLDREYSALCGYTQLDLETVFAEYFVDFEAEKIRDWYNGYTWCGEAVYNPFDILLLFRKQDFRPYWFETGTPTFLVELWKQQPRMPAEYDGLIAGEEILSSFEIASFKNETLLFQTGYLTIKDHVSNAEEGTWYTLGFPNREVRESFSSLILGVTADADGHSAGWRYSIRQAFKAADTGKIKEIFAALLASVPHDWHRKNNIAEYEGYWSTVIYCFLASLGYNIIPEDTTNKGNIDLTMILPESVWIFEFKVGKSAPDSTSPIAWINKKGYAEKYLDTGKAVYKVGMVFNPEKRELMGWKVETGTGFSNKSL